MTIYEDIDPVFRRNTKPRKQESFRDAFYKVVQSLPEFSELCRQANDNRSADQRVWEEQVAEGIFESFSGAIDPKVAMVAAKHSWNERSAEQKACKIQQLLEEINSQK